MPEDFTMMNVVEKSSKHLRLSNADPWGTWVFLFAIISILLSTIFVSAKVIKPVCWSGVVLSFISLVLLIKVVPQNFDTEFWFDKQNNGLKVIKHPWIGSRTIEYYSLSDITEVKVVAKPRNTHNYPGHDYDDAEIEQPVESPKYNVEIAMRSGNSLTIYDATHLVPTIIEFLELTPADA